ncbi:carbohydrate ABC transporter permease [Paenibacillus endoradicis]|uniref:carbohydrate ABC transporter permease n=1 Tax=Paenibacillus endoradicis TaxID=2972487 RepID=UPI002158F26E|nr:sugar ABC transporter permease [Paenibacillus endoradicis]MCR8660226.1 sugar ABC transporter permease [Paenibacillus endoradicis]
MKTVHEVEVKPKIARNKRRLLVARETMAGYLFISPMVLLATVLTIIPILLSGVISFTDWNFIAGLDSIKFIGFDNYAKMFSDDDFLKSLNNNLLLILVIPVSLFISLILAVLINNSTYFKSFFKVIYFMPFISSFVAVAVLWRVLFHPSNGPINNFLMSIGISNPPAWLADPSFSLISVMIIMIWAGVGFEMIIFMAGLQNISKDLYEAADIDGASKVRQFFKITIPLLSPTTFFLLITGIVGSFKVFDLIMILTNGGPAGSTSVIVFYLYKVAFIQLKSGYASAIGIMLLIIILAITVIQWIGQKKWVNY